MAAALTLSGENICEEYLTAMANLPHFPSYFTLTLGRRWPSQRCPAIYPAGYKRQCYQNAAKLLEEDSTLTYAEGYAYLPGLIPVHHAWCIDAEGRVVDNTWDNPENAEYFGIPMSRECVLNYLAEASHWGILAEHINPEVFSIFFEDVQSGPWAVSPEKATPLQQKLNEIFR